MSPVAYAKWGWEDSDVYLFGGVIHPPPDDVHVITCCGCLLARDDPDDWLMGPSFDFETKAGILAHLQVHREAGHVVPETAIKRIEADDWLTGRPPLRREGAFLFYLPWHFEQTWQALHIQCPFGQRTDPVTRLQVAHHPCGISFLSRASLVTAGIVIAVLVLPAGALAAGALAEPFEGAAALHLPTPLFQPSLRLISRRSRWVREP